ncbi:pilus assembly protein N-terminal domain-containing protein [Robiginitomaculum antarcticum]|uniref:pilus assembly protein N-terminal domain-containing protein n=1 Tax=Robiginitomaculum antarcticum TaxID=437507 RepID=UPI00037E8A2F|nr:pilus assembly protein N-terminal domain-containing protein [Robiginitomaculum antarcticum]
MKNVLSRLTGCILAPALIALSAAAFIAPAALAGEVVTMDQTHILKLPRPASAILLGNPDIADVSVYSDDTLFLMGRGFGSTDLLVLDAQGQVILRTDITVVSRPSSQSVTMITGNGKRNTYFCQPYCRPSPIAGDEPGYASAFGPKGAQAQSPVATQSTPAAPPMQMQGALAQTPPSASSETMN